MTFKKCLVLTMLTISFGAHAIPPSPPTIYNKIRSILARNCQTDSGVAVSELKDTESVKFVLQLNRIGDKGLLSVIENGKVIENMNVTCN